MSENITQRANETAALMELYAQKARLLLRGEQELLSAGMAGVVQVAFTCSEDWEGLKKTAVFSNGALTVDVPEENWQGNVCPIPQQVLAAAGKTITVGLYGTDGEAQVLPTVWCALGRVEPGAAPSYSIALSPEAPIWEQLHKRLGVVEAASPFTVQVGSMQTVDDGSVIVSLSHDFAQIEAACATGRLVVMDIFGGKLPLTRLISGNRAEFTGPVFTTGGAAYYTQCIVPDTGDAVMHTLSIGAQLDAPGQMGTVDAIVQQVITALGTPVFGTVDTDNNIILTGGLADGIYVLKYEDAAGNLMVIGTITVGAASGRPIGVNMVPLAINADGTPFVGSNGERGYQTGYRLNSSGGTTANEAFMYTGYMPVEQGDSISFENITFSANAPNHSWIYIHFYDENFTFLSSVTATEVTAADGKDKKEGVVENAVFVYDNDNNLNLLTRLTVVQAGAKYMRIGTMDISDATVIKVLEQ